MNIHVIILLHPLSISLTIKHSSTCGINQVGGKLLIIPYRLITLR